MKYMPIQIKIEDKKILVVGGGNIAMQKIKGILHFTNAITVISPLFLNGVRSKDIEHIEREYIKGDAKGFYLVYVCTNNREVNTFVSNDARQSGALVCVADYQKECDFISPAIFVNDPMVVAVSSSGQAVKKAISWRNKIREFLSDDIS